MISFNLICDEAHEFEGWFRDNADFDGQPSAGAVGDDANRTDDEDGVVFAGTLIPDGVIGVEITASADGLLDAWIDFDGNGDWNDPAEQSMAKIVKSWSGAVVK